MDQRPRNRLKRRPTKKPLAPGTFIFAVTLACGLVALGLFLAQRDGAVVSWIGWIFAGGGAGGLVSAWRNRPPRS